jgi:nuclease A inhibitor-like protein
LSDDADLRRELERAAEGLVYTSESDRPFEWFELAGGAAGWPYGAGEFARKIGAPADAPLEERTLDRFFKPHIESTDPYDTRAQEIRPRYEALKTLLAARLRDVRVFRVGRIAIDCYAVGDDGRGNLAGLRTVAVET